MQFWSSLGRECLSSAFAAGVLGNLIASGIEALGIAAFRKLQLTQSEILNHSACFGNHHLLRALALAHLESVVATAELTLTQDLKVPYTFWKEDLIDKILTERDACVLALRQLRSSAREFCHQLKKLSDDDLRTLATIGPQESAVLLRISEMRSDSGEQQLPAQATQSARAALPGLVESLGLTFSALPSVFSDRFGKEWFNLFRRAFWEIIKSETPTGKAARNAFQIDVLARLPEQMRISFSVLDTALKEHDRRFQGIWDDLRALRRLLGAGASVSEVQYRNKCEQLQNGLAAFHLGFGRLEMGQRTLKRSVDKLSDDVIKGVVATIEQKFAVRGRTAAELSHEELERELASRVPHFTPEDLARLIDYARFRADISRIDKYAPAELIGREDELRLLNDALAQARCHETKRPHVLVFVALGGEGKTSLVAKWAAELANQNWPGCDAAFAWSFYSQGTRQQTAASSDLFLKEALTFFGNDADKEFAVSPVGAFEKGRRLARIVGQRRSLLILDGLEPLQYAPTSSTPGLIKDQGIAALLKGLAANNHGMCVVTTRYSLPDLKAFWQTTAQEAKLLRLSSKAGVHLLKTLGVKGAMTEFAALVESVKGHALTLTLLGGFLRRAFQGDIRQRDRVKFEKADEKLDGGHAFRTMAAYEQWLLRDGGNEGRRQVAVLRLMGLFDRPADSRCLAVLRSQAIPSLTDPLAGLTDEDWEFCLSGLEAANLLTVNRDGSGALVSLDAHPHLREYFARQLRTEQPEGWRAAHRRLCEHLCETTKESEQPTLEELQPLYQAVVHGCLAKEYEETFMEVYRARIVRSTSGFNSYHSTLKLGAFGTDLAAIRCFFENTWNDPGRGLSKDSQAWLLNQAALRLRALGRLREASDPLGAALTILSDLGRSSDAAGAATNLSAVELALGKVESAIASARQAVAFADESNDAFHRVVCRTALGFALHQRGNSSEAKRVFVDARKFADTASRYTRLYSTWGFRWADFFLAEAERNAWRAFIGWRANSAIRNHNRSLAQIERTVRGALSLAERKGLLLELGLNHLTLGRIALYRGLIQSIRRERGCNPIARQELDHAVHWLSAAGRNDYLPGSLISRAWLRIVELDESGARLDLNLAEDISMRGSMLLHLIDVHLARARMFNDKQALILARELMAKCPYNRRLNELEDAERAAAD